MKTIKAGDIAGEMQSRGFSAVECEEVAAVVRDQFEPDAELQLVHRNEVAKEWEWWIGRPGGGISFGGVAVCLPVPARFVVDWPDLLEVTEA